MATARTAGQTDTRGTILDIAERLVQKRGFNGFSYADVAAELGLTRAAVHYHFFAKSELGEALLACYTARFADAVARIDRSAGQAFDRLEVYAELYVRVLNDERMCLCGMFAAEYRTMPDAIRDAMIEFFDANQAWVVRVLESGRADGTIRLSGDVDRAAQMIIGILEGAMLVARPYSDAGKFRAVADQLLGELRMPAPSQASRASDELG